MTDVSDEKTTTKPALDLKFYSHATLEVRDLQRSRKFYEEFLGFDTVAPSQKSLWVRLGGPQIIVVVEADGPPKVPMSFLYHNGLDVATEDEVDRAHAIVVRDAEKWGLTQISKPRVQHGTYSFFFWDGDQNCWEILSNPDGGYSWMFERGDQEGSGHMARSFARPESTLTKTKAK